MTQFTGAGTPESQWLPFLAGLDLPRLSVDPAPDLVVAVAPHPDDEVLAVGGLLAMLAAAGSPVQVVSVSDGEASHPGGSVGPAELEALRVAETVAALGVLGLRAGVQRLSLPDGGGAALEQPVADALRVRPGTWLVGPWVGDGHPDHEAVGRGCATVAERDGARLLAYPVWAWHWSAPADPRVPWARAVLVDLPPDVRASKERAIAEFVTQTQPLGPSPADAPILPPGMLERFTRPWELVFS